MSIYRMLITLFLSLFLVVNCSSTQQKDKSEKPAPAEPTSPFLNYLYNRGMDILDIFTLTGGVRLGLGAELNVSIASFGLLIENQRTEKKLYGLSGGSFSSHNKKSYTYLIGFSSDKLGHRESYQEFSNEQLLERRKLYNSENGLPSYKYGRVGLKLALVFLTLEAEVNLAEALDLLVGIFSCDPFRDDKYGREFYQ